MNQKGYIPLSQDHNHEADEHYHGEPSRVLEDDAYPSSVVLYPGTPENKFMSDTPVLSEDDLTYWLDRLKSLKNTNEIYTSVNSSVDYDDINVHSDLSFGGKHPGSFISDPLLSKQSLLFIPGHLRMEPEAWEDLEKNDVTVNWLAIDPDRQQGETPQVMVLSDWIVKLGSDVSRPRSAGTAPGIFHLTEDCFEDFIIDLNETNNIWTSINHLIDESGAKFRPGFIRGRDWHFVDTTP